MTKTKFKIGDMVEIDWSGDKSHGKIGTIVKNCDASGWTVKIPGFDGHSGDIEDGTKDKRYVSEQYLIKLSSEIQSTFKFKPIVICLLFGLSGISLQFLSNHFGENSQENFQLVFKNIVLIAFDIKCWLIVIWIKDFDF